MASSESPQSPPDPEQPGVQTTMQGSLLIAVPRLQDPNFQRMVVLMVSHDAEGAFGIVLGPEAPLTIADLCESLGMTWTRGPEAPLRYGGPCEPSRIWVLHGGQEPLPGTTTVAPGVHLGSSLPLLQLILDRPNVPVVILSGYAGWAAGQLEDEMHQKSWLPGDISAELVFDTTPDDVWNAALRTMDLSPGFIVSGQGASA